MSDCGAELVVGERVMCVLAGAVMLRPHGPPHALRRMAMYGLCLLCCPKCVFKLLLVVAFCEG